MKIKKFKRPYLVLFIAALCLPCLLWLAFGESVDSENYENRALAVRPVFHIGTYGNYPSEYEAYFNDRLPFRNKLVTFNSWLHYCVFHDSVDEIVILGRNKWLFYKDVNNESVMDYEGTNSFSDDEIGRFRETLFNVQNRLGEMGIAFGVLIPPNKERIYSEYMPEQYKYSEASRTDLMIEALQKEDIHIINPKDDLLRLKSDYQIYYAYDTHWNQLGAYVGTCCLLKSWEMETVDLPKLTVMASKLKGHYHESGLDDLANMLHLRDSVFNDELEYSIKEAYSVDLTQVTGDLLDFHNPQAPYNQTVFLLGDSFRVSMIPALCTYFSNVYVVLHRSNYTHDMLEKIKPDYLILEYVERCSGDLAGIEQLIFEQ